MAETIKGINVVIGAETTGLSAALSDVNKRSRDIQSELKQVEKLLKLDPTNTELLAQKQKLLSDAIGNTKDKLDRLKAAQEQVNQQFANGQISEGQYRAFQRELAATEQQLKNLESQVSKTKAGLDQIGESMQKAGKSMTDAGKKLSTTVTAPIVGLGGFALKAGIDFEAAMSQVQAISGASGDDLARLTDKAKEMGATTKFSASESAEALKYMAMAGWDTNQMLDGLEGVMNLAAASGEQLGTVSDIVTDSMTAFGLAANQAGQFADILAAASSKSNTNVAMLGESFKYVAPVAGALGYSAEDTAVALGLMANAGIKASQSGTSLRSALTNLADPSKEMRDVMQKLGLSITDSSGNMKSLDTIMGDLRKAFGGLDKDQQAAYASTLFGKEAMSGMLAIINTSEADYNKLSDAIRQSSGSAKQMAAVMNDNAKGGLTQLKSALEGVAIQLSETLIPIFNDVIAAIKKAVDWFAGLDTGAQKTVLVIAGIAAAIGPALIIIGQLVTAVGAIISAFTAASGAVAAAGGIMAVLTGPIGITIAAVAGLAAAAYLIYDNWGPISTFFVQLWDSVSAATAKAWDWIKSSFTELWEWTKGFFAEWGPAILVAIAPFIGIPLLIYQHWDDISSFFTTLWDGISTYLSEIWNGIKSAAVNAFQGLYALLEPILNGYKTFFSGIWDAIKNIFAGALLLIIDLVTGDFKALAKDTQAIWSNLKEAFGRIWDGIKQIFVGTLDAIQSVLSTTWEAIKTAAESAWTGIKTAITTIVGATAEWIRTTWNSLLNWFRDLPGKLYTIGSDMFTRMREAVVTTVGAVKEAIVTGIGSAIDWLQDLPSTMMELGKNAIQGLIDGIKNMVGKVGDVIKGVADKVTGGIRDALGIHSPSRVLMQLGEFTGEGFAKGIGNSISDVRQQAASMAAAASGVLADVTPSVSVSGAAGASAAGGTVIQMEGMFAGATFQIRSDDDIRQLAREIWSMTGQAQRGMGGAMG